MYEWKIIQNYILLRKQITKSIDVATDLTYRQQVERWPSDERKTFLSTKLFSNSVANDRKES